MEAGPYLTVTQPGTVAQQALRILALKAAETGPDSGLQSGGAARSDNVASAPSPRLPFVRTSRVGASGPHARQPEKEAYRQAGLLSQASLEVASRMALSVVALTPRNHVLCGSIGRYCMLGASPSAKPPYAGDPVNMATGEEEQAPDPDLTVYNPNGPSVVWRRLYRSLRGGGNDNSTDDFGDCWSRSYNVLVNVPGVRNVIQLSPSVMDTAVATGTTAPSGGLSWEIVRTINGSTSTVVTSASPGGWIVTLRDYDCSVTPPVGIADGVGYTIRWFRAGYNRSARFDILGPSRVPQAGQAITLPSTGTTPPDNYVSGGSLNWQLLREGITVATKLDPQGWIVTMTADLKPKVRAPLSATVSDNYEVRCRSYSYPNYSNTSAAFALVPCRLEASTLPKYLVMPNYGRLAFTPPALPTPSQPVVRCPLTQGGNGMLVEWNYDPNCPLGYYTVLFTDGSRWVMYPAPPYQFTANTTTIWNNFLLRKVVDRMGHAITFNYGPGAVNGQKHLPALASITDDASGTTLLTVTRATDGYGRIKQVTDCYGRSVYYTHAPTYFTWWGYASSSPPSGASYSVITLNAASQAVPTGTPTPPLRFSYGYVGTNSGSSNVIIAAYFLASIGAPSPTGSGIATTTLEYNNSLMAAAIVTDPSGNRLVFSEVDSNHTKVNSVRPDGTLVLSRVVGFNTDQNQTSLTDGNGIVTQTALYGDANSPTLPSLLTDAEGHSAQFTYDRYGNLHTSIDIWGNTTTYTWDYTTFPLGRLMQTQTQGRAPVSFTYYEPSGLLQSVTSPSPAGGTRTATYTYDSYGNLLSVTGPGSGAVGQITTTLNYTQDGAFTQPLALGRPLTVTDNLGHSFHLRYDEQGRVAAAWDALGNRTDTTYNIVGQPLTVDYPATGQTGIGRSSARFTYQSPAGASRARRSGMRRETRFGRLPTTMGLRAKPYPPPAQRSPSAEPTTLPTASKP